MSEREGDVGSLLSTIPVASSPEVLLERNPFFKNWVLLPRGNFYGRLKNCLDHEL